MEDGTADCAGVARALPDPLLTRLGGGVGPARFRSGAAMTMRPRGHRIGEKVEVGVTLLPVCLSDTEDPRGPNGK